ncbi:hypothetical protein PM082_000637 [Marasmius tenuissimus]|nr:hypothetical protein PM082_000637 [Marasmius tenuissimus]
MIQLSSMEMGEKGILVHIVLLSSVTSTARSLTPTVWSTMLQPRSVLKFSSLPIESAGCNSVTLKWNGGEREAEVLNQLSAYF